MSSKSKVTTDHKEIQKWVGDRGGRPATVKGTADKDESGGLLRIDYEGFGDDENLEPISWEDFFEKFEESKLAFLYQEETTGGDTSRFSKFVRRDENN
jgi:hypothetical protein